MDDEVKQEIETVMMLLKKVLLKNDVSMALAFEDKKIYFFDTDTYLQTKKMSGIAVDIDSLVKE